MPDEERVDPWIGKALVWLQANGAPEPSEELVAQVAELLAEKQNFCWAMQAYRERLNEQRGAELLRTLTELLRGGKHDGWSVDRVDGWTLHLRHADTHDRAEVRVTRVDAFVNMQDISDAS